MIFRLSELLFQKLLFLLLSIDQHIISLTSNLCIPRIPKTERISTDLFTTRNNLMLILSRLDQFGIKVHILPIKGKFFIFFLISDFSGKCLNLFFCFEISVNSFSLLNCFESRLILFKPLTLRMKLFSDLLLLLFVFKIYFLFKLLCYFIVVNAV